MQLSDAQRSRFGVLRPISLTIVTTCTPKNANYWRCYLKCSGIAWTRRTHRRDKKCTLFSTIQWKSIAWRRDFRFPPRRTACILSFGTSAWPFKMGHTSRPQSSIINCQSAPRKIPEQGKPLILTYSMVQSSSWEANWFAASQGIPRISQVHYRTHKRPPPVPILGQPNPVHIPTSHLL